MGEMENHDHLPESRERVAEDLLPRDPVCHMWVANPRRSLIRSYAGVTYRFCSTGCRERFEREPERYLAAPAGGGPRCIACGNEVGVGIVHHGGPLYCCERCAFRHQYLGGALGELEGPYLATVEAFVAALDAREHEVGDHSVRVAQFAVVLARQMHITGRPLVAIYCGALLHDLGKIGIPDAILHKQGELSPEEWQTMERHPEIGRAILAHIGELAGAVDIVYGHHEHYDGTGYPQGLRGTAIPLGARIFAVCDTLDALTVDRPYRVAMPFDEAQATIVDQACRLFDPVAVAAFVGAEEDLQALVNRIVI
ncbi:MAG TPA: HD domain-containing phosphohydrolase [bacterium]